MHTQSQSEWFWYRGLGGHPKGYRPRRVGDRWLLGLGNSFCLGWHPVVGCLVRYLHVAVARGVQHKALIDGLKEWEWFEWAVGRAMHVGVEQLSAV